VKNALIINLNDIGDVLFSTSAVRNLKENGYSVDFVIDSSCAGTLDGNLYIDNLYPLDRNEIRGLLTGDGEQKARQKLREVLGGIFKNKYDICINMHSSRLSALIAAGADATLKRGYIFTDKGYIYQDAPFLYSNLKSIENRRAGTFHAISLFNSLLCGLGFDVIDYPVSCGVKTGQQASEGYVLHIGSGASIKKWETGEWAFLAAGLVRDGSEVFITGIKRDIPEALAIKKMAGENPLIKVLCGTRTLPEFKDFLSTKRWLISTDTGITHMASAFDMNIIAIYGNRNMIESAPLCRNGLAVSAVMECVPCFRKTCGHRNCMKAVKGAAILDIIKVFGDPDAVKAAALRHGIAVYDCATTAGAVNPFCAISRA
jgi:ADP-heptose:LPS heptosyltransferase